MANHAVLPRLALAHFGDAWLTRRQLGQDEYRHPARVLDEAVERGFNAIALDPCPHLVAPRPDGVVLDRFELQGEHAGVMVQPRRALLEFAREAQKRELVLWLSSRFLADTQARRSFVRRPRDYVEAWAQTLSFLKQHDVLDTVVAVDFCQHFPLPPSAHGPARQIFGRSGLSPRARLGRWRPSMDETVQSYLHEVPRALKALFPAIQFGVSVTAQTDKPLRGLDTSELDFIDRHLWLDEDPRFALLTGMPARGLTGQIGGALAGALQGRVEALAWRANRALWQRHQQSVLAGFNDFCRVRRHQPVLSRGFAHVPSDWHLDWDFLRELSGFTLRSALSHDIHVITPGYLARPHTPACWSQTAWLQDVNGQIRAGRASR